MQRFTVDTGARQSTVKKLTKAASIVKLNGDDTAVIAKGSAGLYFVDNTANKSVRQIANEIAAEMRIDGLQVSAN